MHGRVYRVTAVGRPLLTPARIFGQPIPALLDLLKEPENRVRYRAKIELSARDTKEVMAALQTWTDRLDPKDPRYEHHMMEALWVHQWHNRVNEKLLARMLQVDRAVGPRRRDARALLLARPRRQPAADAQDARGRRRTRPSASRPSAPPASSRPRKRPRSRSRRWRSPPDRFLSYTLDQDDGYAEDDSSSDARSG